MKVGDTVEYKIGKGWGLANVNAIREDGSVTLLTGRGVVLTRAADKVRPRQAVAAKTSEEE